jgi:hypothetical protein
MLFVAVIETLRSFAKASSRVGATFLDAWQPPGAQFPRDAMLRSMRLSCVSE